MAGLGCVAVKWPEGGGGTRLKNFGELDGKIAVLAHIKTALLKVNIGCVSVGSFLFNKKPDALINQIYSVIKLYMFRAFSLPIIRSSLL